MVAFGTQATCYIPPERRRTQKTPGQARSYDGIVIGYVKDMQAYVVWDIEQEKKREVSFYHTIVHEGFYPFRDKQVARKEKEEAPGSFKVSYEELLAPGELEKFHFSEKEKEEIIDKHFGEREGERKSERERETRTRTCARRE